MRWHVALFSSETGDKITMQNVSAITISLFGSHNSYQYQLIHCHKFGVSIFFIRVSCKKAHDMQYVRC